VRRVIIHIGVRKTGTTSLQRAFEGEKPLLAKHGIVYAAPAGKLLPANHMLANALIHQDTAALSEEWLAVEAIAGDAPTILLSSENFSEAESESIAAFKHLMDRRLSRPDYTIYVGIRRWADRLISQWQQSVRFGLMTSLPDYVASQLAAPAEGHLLDISRPIARWSGIFGAPAVMVSAVDRAAEANQDLLVHVFREMLGIDAAELAGRYTANKSAIEQTELVRAVNLRSPDATHAERGAIARCILRYIRLRKRKALKACDLIARNLASMTRSDDQPLFRQLEKRSGHSFPARAPRPWRYAPDAAFSDRSLSHLIDELHERALRRIARRSQ